MLYIAADHGGYKLKKRIMRYFKNELKTKIEDLGAFEYDKDDDYPDYALPLLKKVSANKEDKGILVCGSGQGMCIMANKFKNVRTTLGYNIESAEMGRLHNNSNILCLAGYVLTEDHALAIIKKWLETPFSNAKRHIRRLKKVEEINNK